MGDFRKRRVTRPIHRWARKALPGLSETEAAAIDAGEVWWEAELFTGTPDWDKLGAVAKPALTEAEQAFIDGPCRELCAMLDAWEINRSLAGLPPEVWAFLRKHRFFGMIIPEAHGGLGFSAYAHSEVVRLISTRSIVAAVTVMVPNSLGPGELLLQFGTEAQQDHWLPRLADGRELPAFGLTSEEAGSDAAAMVDEGVVCKGTWQGEEVTGIRLNFSKRYISLAPVCTVLGLAFRLRDPDGLLGSTKDHGITCALVPADLPGVERGRRHIPSDTMFQNGPVSGEDVFIPLDNIIGGPENAGRGWEMLMAALAAGRGISLPSLSAAATALSAHTTGAYARMRQQFGLPIGKFGGVQEPMARLAAAAYRLDAARTLTCAGLDEGRKLAVISAIIKANATYSMRDALNDAMDVHSGKAVIDGPLNYLSPLYKALPIGITVEGANILTRSLIIFGQGAIRAHPHLLDEIRALENDDEAASLDAFDKHFWRHAGHVLKNAGRATVRAWSGARLGPAPEAGKATPIYRAASRWAAAFALTVEAAFLSLGGDLKRREMISARLGDALSELYFLSAVLKRWQDDGRPEADFPLVDYNARRAFHRIGRSLDEVVANLPGWLIPGVVRILARPGAYGRAPDDTLTATCAELIYDPSETRDRITGRMFEGCARDGIRLLNDTYALVTEVEPLRKKLREAEKTPDEGVEAGLITEADRARLAEADAAVAEVVRVDDFSPEELTAYYRHANTAPDAAREAAE
ncbi:acyl-CoA dehydrogenase [Psychromarinibacter sp. C21-152]|uniref:Acyl-coenzyme A dehydrogenase n=1 Tax=Psychromarinibacter sediminicola TaxID=3033385 RepID=A0AAE3NT29_9RHOB|nr:acyl-CoA dehydrogenase [Psychromarinibacter sediminicola]MDF0603028.1 acyl-CoA dehydrogenase [Psychromarinibacter sediminicola]